MPQFFIDRSFEVGSKVSVTGRDAHHIINVLRLKAGDWLVLSDGKGKSYRSKIVRAKSKVVEVIIEEVAQRHIAMPPPALAFAVIKHDRSEWIIQKAVELGCTHLIPFYCRRTIPKFKSAHEKIRRWREIALEAAKQSGLPVVPQVDLPVEIDNLCALIPKFEKTILFWEGENKVDLRSLNIPLLCKPALSNVEGEGQGEVDLPHPSSPYKGEVLLIIGPEGGFDESEIDRAKLSGAVTASLGRQILRVETAVISALAIAQYELGNLSI